MGRSPHSVFAERQRPDQRLTEEQLREALTIRGRRRIRRDSTLSVDGHLFETHAGFLAGRIVTVARCHLDRPPRPWIEREGRRLELHPVDPVANATRPRPELPAAPERPVHFDPPTALLDRTVGRAPRHAEQEKDR